MQPDDAHHGSDRVCGSSDRFAMDRMLCRRHDILHCLLHKPRGGRKSSENLVAPLETRHAPVCEVFAVAEHEVVSCVTDPRQRSCDDLVPRKRPVRHGDNLQDAASVVGEIHDGLHLLATDPRTHFRIKRRVAVGSAGEVHDLSVSDEYGVVRHRFEPKRPRHLHVIACHQALDHFCVPLLHHSERLQITLLCPRLRNLLGRRGGDVGEVRAARETEARGIGDFPPQLLALTRIL
mmetsp:Transcript_21103/g.42564  ORF Transcript_21103/g.42564 Transcript_21103/m.42564 type:complete len:235 (+) Transcript_21103:183-887(+)